MKNKYITIKINSKLSLSDINELDYRNKRLKKIDYFKYSDFDKIYNLNSEKIVKFFIEYKNGLIIPDRCDVAEPIRDKFIPDKYQTQIKWLSQLGSALYLKKTKGLSYECFIENKHLMMIWDEKGDMKIPVISDPEYLCEFKLFINYNVLKNIGTEIIIELYNDLIKLFDSDSYSIEGITI